MSGSQGRIYYEVGKMLSIRLGKKQPNIDAIVALLNAKKDAGIEVSGYILDLIRTSEGLTETPDPKFQLPKFDKQELIDEIIEKLVKSGKLTMINEQQDQEENESVQVDDKSKELMSNAISGIMSFADDDDDDD